MALIPYFKGVDVIVDTESQRDLSWGQGVKIYCRDTGGYYIIDEGAFKPIETYFPTGLVIKAGQKLVFDGD